MKRRKRQTVIINQRDLDLFDLIFRRKVMDQDEIQKMIFTGRHPTILYKRLYKLYWSGYIDKGFISVNDRPKAVYWLTRKGYREIFYDKDLGGKFTKMKSDKIMHDLGANKVLDRFKELEGIDLALTENEIMCKNPYCKTLKIKDFQDQRSDGFLQVTRGDKQHQCAIEYERSVKAKDRYLLKLKKYKWSSDVKIVFYVCKTESILRAIKKVETLNFSEYGRFILYITEDQFLNSKQSVTFFDKHEEAYVFNARKKLTKDLS